MKYQFPTIKNISDVLPAIAGSSEFIVAEREGYCVINYMVSLDTTFPEVTDELSAIRRECRGLIFDSKSGRILRRPFHKFWNINEREETRSTSLEFNKPHKVYTKLDGSMLAPFELGHGTGVIRWGTKMGAGTDVAMAAEVFVAKNMKYQKFAEWCIKQDITPIFEFTTPGKHRIVIGYERPMLTLLAARYMITGKYLSINL